MLNIEISLADGGLVADTWPWHRISSDNILWELDLTRRLYGSRPVEIRIEEANDDDSVPLR